MQQCVLPVRAHQEAFPLTVLNKDLFSRRPSPSSATYEELDGKVLAFPDGHMPYRRLLSYLATDAVKHARDKNFMRDDKMADFKNFLALSISSLDKEKRVVVQQNFDNM